MSPQDKRPGALQGFLYSVHGLSVHSQLLLPAFHPPKNGTGAHDVSIRFAATLPKGEPDGRISGTAGHMVLSVDGVGRFRVSEGREILMAPEPHVEEVVLQLWVMDCLMVLLLYQRGMTVLHASAVAVQGGGGLAFLGSSGSGKSFLAAALHSRGHLLLCDDVAAVRTQGAHPAILPSFPRLKLFPDVATLLGYRPELLTVIHPQVEKLSYSDADGFRQEAVPLTGIYFLSSGGTAEVESIRPGPALLEMIQHSYGLRSLEHLIDRSRHFLCCASIANAVPAFRLKWDGSPSGVRDVVRVIEEHRERVPF